MALTDAAESGSRLQALKALRDDLAARMEVCTSDQNFSVMGRLLSDTLTQIDDLGGGVQEVKKETALDEFSQRLNARRQPAPTSARSASVD